MNATIKKLLTTSIASLPLLSISISVSATDDLVMTREAWIVNSHGISKDDRCVEKAKKGFQEIGYEPYVDNDLSSPAVYKKGDDFIMQVRCVENTDYQNWWYVMVVGDDGEKRRMIRNKLADNLSN